MRGINTLMAVVVITGIVISISVVVALWIVGLSNVETIGSQYSKVDIVSLEAYGVFAKVFVVNKGTRSVGIDNIMLNNREAVVRVAYDHDDLSRVKVYLDKSISSDPFYIEPSHTAVLWIIPEKPLEAGVFYDVKIHTSEGYVYEKTIEAEISVSSSIYRILLFAFTNAPSEKDLRGCIKANGNISVIINEDLGDSRTFTNGNLSSLANGVPGCTWEIYLDKKLREGRNIIAIDYNVSGKPYLDFLIGVNYWVMNKWLIPVIGENKWKYHVGDPGTDWFKPNYNDNDWSIADLPIGSYGWYATKYDLEDGKAMYFRKNITIPSTFNGIEITRIKYAELRVASDDYVNVFINGEYIGGDNYSHGARYWNYTFPIMDPESLGILPGKTITVAIKVVDTGGGFYFDESLFLEIELSNGIIMNITIPEYPSIKYYILNDGEKPPKNWWKLDFNDSGWSTGYLPIGINQDIGNNVHARVNTWINSTVRRVLVRIKFTLNNIPWGTDPEGYYDRLHTGYNGHAIVFDMVKLSYEYYNVFNPSGDPKKIKEIIFYGRNNVKGYLNDVLQGKLPPIYHGTPKFLINSLSAEAESFETPPTSPIILVLNTDVLHEHNFTWTNLNGAKDKFIMEPVPRAVPGMDIIMLWEDIWNNPNWNHGEFKDSRAWMDHVVRITWLDNGVIRVGLYRCSGWYLHVLVLRNKYVYYKPHNSAWGDDTREPFTYKEDNILIHYEIGYNPSNGKEEEWISPTGYIVKIWYISP